MLKIFVVVFSIAIILHVDFSLNGVFQGEVHCHRVNKKYADMVVLHCPQSATEKKKHCMRYFWDQSQSGFTNELIVNLV